MKHAGYQPLLSGLSWAQSKGCLLRLSLHPLRRFRLKGAERWPGGIPAIWEEFCTTVHGPDAPPPNLQWNVASVLSQVPIYLSQPGMQHFLTANLRSCSGGYLTD
jgi:hypothetical protein